MRRYWDDRARANAAWYVDTSLAYDEPDMERFFATGERIAELAVDEAPVGPARADTALEIGCGLGRVVKALRRRFPEVIGVDISAEMLERARALVDEPGVRFLLGDGVSLRDVPTASVDLVVSFTVFQHIPDAAVIDGYLAEAGRILRPGGTLAFQWNNEPGPWRWAIRRRVLATLQRAGIWREHRHRHAPEFLGCRVPLARVDRTLAAAGLERVGLRGAGTLYAWAWARRA